MSLGSDSSAGTRRKGVVKGYVLVVDIGNTSTSLGLYRRGRISRGTRQDTRRAHARGVEKKIRLCCGERHISGAVLASVVPQVTGVWARAIRKICGVTPLQVNHTLNFGVRVTYPRPDRLGADRLANACGAAARYGTPVIVADFGTALTFDVVRCRKGYVGGVIAPGLPLVFEYLAEKTALLPRVKPGRVFHGVGKSTAEAIRLGAAWGYRGMALEILRCLKKKNRLSDATVCATGGYASRVLGPRPQGIVVDPDLTLFGLGRIYELNAGRRESERPARRKSGRRT